MEFPASAPAQSWSLQTSMECTSRGGSLCVFEKMRSWTNTQITGAKALCLVGIRKMQSSIKSGSFFSSGPNF